MSYNRYNSEWSTRISHAVELARAVSNPIVDLVSLSASGRNYTNIRLNNALALYASSDRLLFFTVQAQSDFSEHEYSFAWSRELGDAFRTNLTFEDRLAQQIEIEALEQRLNTAGSDDVKLNFLLNRGKELLQRIEEDMGHTKQYCPQFKRITAIDDYYLDEDNAQLLLKQDLRNVAGGEIILSFDATPLLNVKSDIQFQLLKEASLAFLFSLLLIIWATRRIVKPLKNIALQMNRDVKDIDFTGEPEIERKDELGVVVRSLDSLAKKVQLQIVELEKRSAIDSLTGLGSRFLYESVKADFVAQTRRQGKYLGFLICDLDNFKAFNDMYGHPEGDRVLRRAGLTVQSALKRDTDGAYRLGGEEFIVLLQTQSAEDIQQIAVQLCAQLEGLEIEHLGNPGHLVLTLSIGVVCAKGVDLDSNVSMDQIYELADKALYRAKDSGRNAINVVHWKNGKEVINE
ncbi:sensor domain-containing diguanylate cyclase [Alginatibacterium sediminis]|nr:sensor domain-containing diguanylate cyclase [Alginatibacterium sediminis]